MCWLASQSTRAVHLAVSRQVDEATRHWDVADVHSPHLIRASDRLVAQQIRVDLVSGRGFRSVGLAIKRLNPHAPHQRAYMFSSCVNTALDEHVAQ